MRRRLLLADDSPTIQRVIELTFAAEDYDVTCVSDGQQAIESIEAEPPDVIVADIDMPEKSGYEVSAFVKDAPALTHIPVVLLTGAFEPIDEARARAARADAVLAKPFEPRAVVEQVRALVAAQASAPVGEFSRSRPGPRDAPAQEPAGDTESVDEYLDRLDAAFASLGSAPTNRHTPEHSARSTGADEGGQSLDEGVPADEPPIERWTRQAAEPPAAAAPIPMISLAEDDVPQTVGSSASSVPSARVGASKPMTAVESPDVPAGIRVEAPPERRPIAVDALPLADAFEELLATEQGEVRPGGPVATADPDAVFDRLVARVAVRLGERRVHDNEPRGSDPSMSDELVDRVARRVVERMGDGPLRETIADVVLTVADRLVREEIERIKSDAT